MMIKEKVLTICLGNNSSNVYGSNNDVILFYNYIYNLIERNKYKNKTEYLYSRPKILLNEDVTIDNILEIIKRKIKNDSMISRILIFYSGHGYSNGYFNIKDPKRKMVNKKKLIKYIDNILTKEIKLNFIFDSCYSGIVINYDKFKFTKEIKMISSTSAKQKANETICSYNTLVKEKKLRLLLDKVQVSNNNMIVGIFTFNFLNILYREDININDWNLFIKDKFWKKLKKMINQYPSVDW